MSVISRRRAKRALVSLCASCLLLAFAASAGVQDARVIWVTTPGSVYKVSAQDGSVALHLSGLQQPQALAVDDTNDTLWLYGQLVIKAYDPQGDLLLNVTLPNTFQGGAPNGMAVDDSAGNLWIAVQHYLYRLNMAGVVQQEIILAGNATGVSLDAADSRLWVAEQGSVQVFDATGNVALKVPVPSSTNPTAIAYDADLKQAWLLFSNSVERLDAVGNIVMTAALGTDLNVSLTADNQGGVWVRGQKNLAYLATNGQAQFVIQPFASLDGGNIVALAADPLDHSAWVANPLHLLHYDTTAKLIQTAALSVGPGPGNGIFQTALYTDTIPPVVSISTPADGTYTKHNQPTLTLTYSDIGSGVDPTSVAVTNGAAAVPVSCQANADGSGAICTPSSALPDGGYALLVTVKDYAGNVSKAASVSFTIDTVAPTITVTSPNKAYTNQPALTVAGSMSEAGTLSINGTDVSLSAAYGFSEAVTLTEGANTFTFVATDLAGNVTTVTKSITLDTIPPKVPNTGLISVSSAGSGEFTLTGAAGAIDPNTQVTIADSSTGQSVTVTSDATGAFSATLAAQSGDKLTITATDEAGNTSASQLQLPVACGMNAGPGNTNIQFASAAVTVTGPIGAILGFPVTRTGDLSFNAAIDYQTVDGSAVAGQDYLAGSGALTIPAGTSSAVLPVTILGSSTNSPAKAFTLKLQAPQGPQSSLTGPQVYAVGALPLDGVSADLNGDGLPDIVTANYNDNTISVLVNTTANKSSAPTFAAQQTFPVGSGPDWVAAADLNGDGKPDLVVANYNDGTITVLINTTPAGASTVSFAAPQVYTTASPNSVAMADVNGDGKLDIIVANDAPTNTVTIYLNTTAQGAATASFAPPQTFAVGNGPYQVITTDLNGDGKPDVVTVNYGDGTVSVLMNTTPAGATAASFGPLQPFAAGASPISVTAADLNGDGIPDLVIGSNGGPSFTVLMNTTATAAAVAAFGAPQTFAAGSAPATLAAADLDGNGKIDLVAGNVGDNTISVFLNTTAPDSGTVSFTAQQVLPTGGTPWPVLAADLNGDGRPDIISLNESDNTVSVFTDIKTSVCVSPASVTGTIQYNVVPPVISLTGPGEFVTAPGQAIAGSVSKPGTLSIDGTNVPLNPDGTFSYAVTLQPGVNSFTLVATDLSGNVTTLNQTIVLQILVPVGTDMQFQPGTASGTETLVGQSGAATQGETVTVTDVTTGATATTIVNADGSYSVSIAGSSTDNFSVVLTGTDGVSGTPVYLHGNDAALNLSVTYPTNGATINGDTVTVTGTYAGAVDTGITVNGEAATVQNGQFVANDVSLAAGANTLTIVATEEGGLTTTQTLNVTGSGTSPLVLSATSAVGVAPLTVTFTYQYQGTTPIHTLEMSYLGNGTNDVVSSDPTTALSYTYTSPGIYPATLTLIDANGVQYQAVLDVVVQDPAQMDAMFKTLWGDMTVGLASGNKAAAMSTLDYTAQQNYGTVFDALMPHMQQVTGSFSPLLRGDLSGPYGEYAVVRLVNGQANLYFIYFIQDTNGVWRLDAM